MKLWYGKNLPQINSVSIYSLQQYMPYTTEIIITNHQLPCTAINFAKDGIFGGHFGEQSKRMFRQHP